MEMNKEHQLQQLEKERNELLEKCKEVLMDYNNIRTKIRQFKLGDYNYEGKYIFVDEYGYMYVTKQRYDEKSPDGDERMLLQGFAFQSSITEFRDDFWWASDSLMDWNIPINTFQSYVKEKRIKEITKEEFMNEFEKQYDSFHKNYKEMLDQCEKNIQ